VQSTHAEHRLEAKWLFFPLLRAIAPMRRFAVESESPDGQIERINDPFDPA
jgi:hypothetical protein